VDQIHSRIAVSSISWLNALLQVSQAQRGETILDVHDVAQLTASEQSILCPRLGVRAGVSHEVQFELEQKPEEDLGTFRFDPDLADRLLKRARYLSQTQPRPRSGSLVPIR
jgi:hypothetical protein